ncbi:MAG: acyl-[acyl-carrier-protein]--UDP-N-acetylglucosamine O-acyltransferase, partial [Campylobacter curvus]
MKNIHQTAVVEDGARIGEDVKIEAYAFVSKDAVLGDNVTIKQGARVIGNTQIGDNSKIFSYAIVGDIPQDI